ncbi:MAG: tetratricopeptide repeat protein [Rhodospirillales bacterium]|nr:tetratricopeptide repeat protein [Acetobacter sp.]
MPWLSRSNDLTDVVAMCLCGFSALFWLLTMIPSSKARIGTVRTHNDGYKLLHAPRYRPETVRGVIIVTCIHRVEMLWEDGRRKLAWMCIRKLLARYPSEAVLSVTEGHFLAEQGDYAQAAASYERWLDAGIVSEPARQQVVAQRFSALARANKPGEARRCAEEALRAVSPEYRGGQLDALATEVIKCELRAFLPEADAWSQEALAQATEAITLKGTRGSVLVELGRSAEGEALLRQVWDISGSEVDAAISAFYLGVVANRSGCHRDAARWLRRSKGFAPSVGKWLLDRIAKESYDDPAKQQISSQSIDLPKPAA